MNKNEISKNTAENKSKGSENDMKTQNDRLNILLREHYAQQKDNYLCFVVCYLILQQLRKKPGDKYEYKYCNCKNEFEKLIKQYWEDIVLSDVALATENKFKQDYFTSEDKQDIPEGMCALKSEYEDYQDFKSKKQGGDFIFTQNGDNICIRSKNEDPSKTIVYEKLLYSKIENRKDSIEKDEKKKALSHLSGRYVLYPETLVLFLKKLLRNHIDDPEKRKLFLEFLKSDKLKIQDFSSEVMSEVIDRVCFNQCTDINEWFNFLKLNKGHNLSPSVLFKYCRKAQNGKFDWWEPNDIKEILSFVCNYKWPDINTEDYNKEVDSFFGLLVQLFNNLRPGKKIAITSAEYIFDFINKNVPSIKLPINKIEEYENGRKLLEVLKEHFVKIVKIGTVQNNIEFRIETDYSGLFNDFVATRLNTVKCNKLDELSKVRENFISQFIDHEKEIGIDVPKGVAETLFLDTRFVARIVDIKHTEEGIVKTPEDFRQYVAIINKMKRPDEPFPLRYFWKISDPIADNTVPMGDMFEFIQNHTDKKYDMSFISLYCDVYEKIKSDTKWTYENIIRLLSYSKGFSKNKNKDFDCDLKDYFLYLLRDVFENTCENVDMDFWQDVFNWIGGNMTHVYFSNRLLEDHGFTLKRVLKWHGINLYASLGKITVEHDYSYVQEQLDFFVWDYFRTKAESKGDTELKTEKFKSLSDIKSAYGLLVGQFLKKYSKKITAVCVKKELKSKLKVQLYNAYAMQNFIKSIEPGIIKSSDDLRDFIDHVNRINLNKVSAFTGDVGYAADFVSDNSLSIDEVESLLSCLARRGELYPDVLYKYCRKIKKDTKWKFGQIRDFLGYLEGRFELTEQWSDKVLQSESLFGILNYLVSNYIVSKDDKTLEPKAYIYCIFDLLQDKLYRIDFADLLSKADDFENGKEFKQTLKSMGVKIGEINLLKYTKNKFLKQILNAERAIAEKTEKENGIQIGEIINDSTSMEQIKLNQEVKLKEDIKNGTVDIDNKIENDKKDDLSRQSKNKIENGNSSVVFKDEVNNIGKGKDVIRDELKKENSSLTTEKIKEENDKKELEIQQEKDQLKEFNKVQANSINGTENLKVNTDKSKNENGNIINMTNQNSQMPSNSNLETKNSSNNQMKKDENENTVVVDKEGKENSKKDTSNKNKIELKIGGHKDEEGKESEGVEINGDPSKQNNNFVDNNNLDRQNSDDNNDETERSNQKRENNGKGNKEIEEQEQVRKSNRNSKTTEETKKRKKKKKDNTQQSVEDIAQIVKQLPQAPNFAEFCLEMDKKGIILNELDLNKLEFNYIKPGFLDNVLAFFQTIFDTVFNRAELKDGFWEHARRRACYRHIINNKCVNVAEALKNKLNNSNKDKLLGSRQEKTKNQSIRIIPSSEPRENQIKQ